MLTQLQELGVLGTGGDSVMTVDPDAAFAGRLLVAAPHMDDEVLACGGTIGRLADPSRVYIVFATDGMKSPSPIVPWRDRITPDLGTTRMAESQAAARVLGVPAENLRFLGLPEARLEEHQAALLENIGAIIRDIRPDHVLVPFRYDRHPDHLALHRAVTTIQAAISPRPAITEYFVYYRWRLLPGRDVRRYIRPQFLFTVDTRAAMARKRTALACFETQTTHYYSWQTRPILTAALLDEVSAAPEYFLRCGESVRGSEVFHGARPWIRFVHRVEPFLQRWKYRLGAYLRRGTGMQRRNPDAQGARG